MNQRKRAEKLLADMKEYRGYHADEYYLGRIVEALAEAQRETREAVLRQVLEMTKPLEEVSR